MILTTEDVRRKLKLISPGIELLGEYQGCRLPIKCKCKQCEHKWFPTWATLSQGEGCPQCAGTKRADKFRLSLDEIKSRLNRIDPMISIRSKPTEYRNQQSPLKCECRRCGRVWSTIWARLRAGVGCLACKKSTKLTTSELKKKLAQISPRIKILGEYGGHSKDPLLCQCHQCLHKWSPSWQSLSIGAGCPNCNPNRSYTLKSARKAISDWNSDLKLLSSEFVDFKTPLIVKCQKCGRKWTTTLKRLKRTEARCSQCKPHKKCVSENKVRSVIEKITGWQFPSASPSMVPWLNGLQLDGYNEKHKIAFERQGEHHYRLVHFGGGKDTLAKLDSRKKRDQRKRKQCWRRGVKLISIPYWTRDVEKLVTKKLERLGVL